LLHSRRFVRTALCFALLVLLPAVSRAEAVLQHELPAPGTKTPARSPIWPPTRPRQNASGVGCERDTEAFWSGHTSIVAASAGLVWASHRYMPLWGSPVADASACALAVTGALVTGVTRLAADRHYASDVIVGMGVGFGLGYAVPILLHYTRKESPLTLAIQPETLGSGATVSIAGDF
jgi:membrane-associated phospholipid phosphatase